MSYSDRIKDELVQIKTVDALERQAEISGLLRCGGRLDINNEGLGFYWEGDKAQIARRLYTLLREEAKLSMQVLAREKAGFKGGHRYVVFSPPQVGIPDLLKRLELLTEKGLPKNGLPASLLVHTRGKKAFVRGLFLGRGSMNAPERGYYMEILLDEETLAREVLSLLTTFNIDGGVRTRRGYWVLYLNRAQYIVNLMNIIGAHSVLLELESLLIIKEMRNDVNRWVNWETANLDKTVRAAMGQLEDIHFLARNYGLNILPPSLYELALLRLKHPYLTLKELGAKLNPPVGKSGINHRLRRIRQFAAKLRHKGRDS